MAAQPGFSTSLKLSSESATLTNAATTCLTNYTVYQITTAGNRVLDPTQAVLVEFSVNGGTTWNTASGYTLDYLFGKVTFATNQTSATLVRVSGQVKNTYAWLLAKDVSLMDTADVQEMTTFTPGAGTATKSRILTLADCSVEIGMFSSLLENETPGGTAETLNTLKTNGTAFLLEIQFPGMAGTGQDYFRGWFKISEESMKVTPDTLRESSIKLMPAPFLGSGQTSFALWGFGV